MHYIKIRVYTYMLYIRQGGYLEHLDFAAEISNIKSPIYILVAFVAIFKQSEVMITKNRGEYQCQ